MATATARATAATTRFIRALLGNGVYGGNGFTRSNGATEPNGEHSITPWEAAVKARVPRFARHGSSGAWNHKPPGGLKQGLVIPRVARSMGRPTGRRHPRPLRSPPLLRSSV